MTDATNTAKASSSAEGSGDADNTTGPPEGPDWQDIFPYDSPYPEQQDGISTVSDVTDDNGFVLLEGACGTGKTLISLAAGIEKVRDPVSRFQRVLVLTSVRQQLRAFEDDIERINENLAADQPPVTALSMVGKADLCSYVDTGQLDRGSLYTACEGLRDITRSQLQGLSGNDAVERLTQMGDEWATGIDQSAKTVGTDNWESEYIAAHPQGENSPDGCPFYIEYLKDLYTTPENESPYHLTGLYRPDDLLHYASDRGVCPHAMMGEALQTSEVLIGNYQHAFDGQTVDALTHMLLDDSTFIVCDEAHEIEERVRENHSETLSVLTLKLAEDVVDQKVLSPQSRPAKRVNEKVVSYIADGLDVSEAAARRHAAQFHLLVSESRDRLEAFAQTALSETDALSQDWQVALDHTDHDELPRTIEHPLRDPEAPSVDAFTEWVDDGHFDVWEKAEAVGIAISTALRKAAKEDSAFDHPETYCDSVGRLFKLWRDRDHTDYLRLVELERRSSPRYKASSVWGEHYIPKFALNNCIPRDIISETLDSFGGGVLMSATLQPFDVYEAVTGLEQLGDERRVETVSYGLTFPPEHRQSLVVNAKKFTSYNRTVGQANDAKHTRHTYEKLVKGVVRETPGNVLVAMPNYAEGEKMAETLKDDPAITKAVLTDVSSSPDETEDVKQRFFRGDPKVLLTSMRGTLTTGIDYGGQKLGACIVCGLPVPNMGTPTRAAIEAAYAKEFGGDFFGYLYATAAPATREARQAIGRVIRSDTDIGTRAIIDERYTGYLKQILPDEMLAEFSEVDPDEAMERIVQFWTERDGLIAAD